MILLQCPTASRAIARGSGRAASTVTREIAASGDSDGHRGVAAGRRMRQPLGSHQFRAATRGHLRDVVNIRQRPGDTDDRGRARPRRRRPDPRQPVVGDCHAGRTQLSIRTAGQARRRGLRNGHRGGGPHIVEVPVQLRRSVTWDQARTWPATPPSPSTRACRTMSALPKTPGRAAATRIPTGWRARICPRAPISPSEPGRP